MEQMLNSMPIYALYPSLSMVRNAQSKEMSMGVGRRNETQVITGILQTCCCIDMCKSLQIPGVMSPTQHSVEKWLGNSTYMPCVSGDHQGYRCFM